MKRTRYSVENILSKNGRTVNLRYKDCSAKTVTNVGSARHYKKPIKTATGIKDAQDAILSKIME